MIWACYNTYHNADYLAASLYTIAPFVDKIIVVEGRYPEYPETKEDLTGRIIYQFHLQYPDKLYHMVLKPCSQIYKRNIYVNQVPDGDWMLIIDGDEIPFGNLRYLRRIVEAYDDNGIEHVSIKRDDLTESKYHPRLIKKKEGMQYKGHHFYLDCNGKNALYPTYRALCKDIKLIHFADYRGDEVINARQQFYHNSKERELEQESIDISMMKEAITITPKNIEQLYELSKDTQNNDARSDSPYKDDPETLEVK